MAITSSAEASNAEVIAIESPAGFRAVADFYRNWCDVSDEEVGNIMADAERSGLLACSKSSEGI